MVGYQSCPIMSAQNHRYGNHVNFTEGTCFNQNDLRNNSSDTIMGVNNLDSAYSKLQKRHTRQKDLIWQFQVVCTCVRIRNDFWNIKMKRFATITLSYDHAQVFEFPATNTTYCLFLWLHVNGMRDSRLKRISRLFRDSIHSEASSWVIRVTTSIRRRKYPQVKE